VVALRLPINSCRRLAASRHLGQSSRYRAALRYLMLTAKVTKSTKGEKKKRLPDEEKASRTVTINLDGLSHEAIISRVAEVMRDVGSPERDIASFNY
jgi:hypothetical protein